MNAHLRGHWINELTRAPVETRVSHAIDLLMQVDAEREALQVRVAGYQGSRDWAIHALATALGIEADTFRPLEWYARQAAERIAKVDAS